MAEDDAPDTPESATETPEKVTITSAFEKALADSEEKPVETEKPAKSAPAKPVSPTAEEAEHIRWVKKISGMTDKEGQVNLDAVAKAYFEMNKGFQSNAQRLNQINQLLDRPDVKAAIEATIHGKKEEPKPKEDAEKTDEEILADFIDQRAKAIAEERVKPVLVQNQAMFNKFLKSETESAGHQMETDYGVEEFQAMWPDIYQTVAQAASAQNLQPAQLITNLVVNGVWLQTMQNIANNLAAPKLRTQLAELKEQRESKELEAKKRTRLTPKGSSEKSVKEAVKIRNIRDAAKAAEADHPEFAELK